MEQQQNLVSQVLGILEVVFSAFLALQDNKHLHFSSMSKNLQRVMDSQSNSVTSKGLLN